jgi:PKD repeat protein
MARINPRGIGWRLVGPVLASLAVITALTAAPMAAEASTNPGTGAGPSSGTATALTQAFEEGRHLPGPAIGGIRPGSLHTGTAAGTEWAIATFIPSASASKQVATGFQDGGGTGIFSLHNGIWRLLGASLYGCGEGLPSALKQAWGLADPAGCTASIATQRAAAGQSLSTFSAQVRAKASAASKATATPRSTANQSTQADLNQAIASIALTQVGTSDTPTSTSFAADCDPYSTLTAGFSANSDGCGSDPAFGVRDENETWCADFNKWVWEQAGVTSDMNTLNAGSVSFYDWAQQQGETLTADTGTPAVGDSIVFFEPSLVGRYADHVGIVTSVNPDGTIDMVNGDFLGASTIHVEYDTNISLTSWAAANWGAGEQWFIVTPPTAAQQPVPVAAMSGPRSAVTGTDSSFHARAVEPGGSVTAYYWTFGDGRTSNSTGQDVTHVYSEPGTYTASVTVTSSFGTISTLTKNVTVLGASSVAAAVPSTAVWWATTPVDQYMFVRSAGGLAADTWDGASWLQATVPGDPSASGGITALSYPDPAANDATTPHAYFRAADGSLAQTYLGASGWVTQDLPGNPADNSNIAATTVSATTVSATTVSATTGASGPSVFFVNAAGQLAESSERSGTWTTSILVPDGPALSPASLTLADTASGPVLFGVGPAGTIRAASADNGVWFSRAIPAKTTANGSLSAFTTQGGQAAVVYVDAHGAGLAEATATSATTAGAWKVTGLPGSPAPSSSLAATTYLLPSAVSGPLGTFPSPPGSLTPSGPAQPLGTEAFYRTASGAPGVTFNDGTGWQTAVLPSTGLPGTGTVVGASAYPVAYQPMQLFLATASGRLTEDSTTGPPSGTWATQSLPAGPSAFADRVVLYAATPADQSAALSAATAAGIPADQVTTSFVTAWDDTLSGDYLLFAVGQSALNALEFNACGWANPSTDIPGSTPFDYVTRPLNALIPAGLFMNGAAATASQTPQRATDLVYYAVHGTLPPGITSVPTPASAARTCSGSPS